jgi:alpha-N-arabinofuranosidase
VGQVKFGDNVHGAVPASGASVVADYTSTHFGFVDFYQRMKAVDPSIDVCAAWGQTAFPTLFKELAPPGSKYDCLTAHPYTHFQGENKDVWDSALEAHDWHMISSSEERGTVIALRDAVNANTLTPHPYVAISEYGALWGPEVNTVFPEYNFSMTHALYMANQWMNLQTLGVPWAAGNDLSSNGWYTLLGPDNHGFISSAEAVAREAVKPMFTARGRQVLTEIAGGPVRDPANTEMCNGGAPTSCQDAYPKLRALASRAPNGTLYVMVVNRSPFQTDAIPIDVTLHGFTGTGTATVRQVAPAAFTSHNDAETPNAVTLSTSTRAVGTNSFRATLPPFSITLFILPPA